MSKWRGDSEKLVRVLFDLARHYAPSTIFLDEIDSILSSRDGEGGEHEASRRMKTELLIQMDGLISNTTSPTGTNVHNQVFVMAASNLPWDLDIALLRRLEKRVFVPLPGLSARENMLKKHLEVRSSGLNYADIAGRMEGYSGADIELVCREAAMMPVRRLIKKIEAVSVDSTASTTNNTLGQQHIPEPPRHRKHNTYTIKNTKPVQEVESLLREDPVTAEDVSVALGSTKPSSDGKMDKYAQWQQEYGSV